MMPSRQLLVVADDFGIGPEVSRGILELMRLGTVTSTVLLVNSPFAEESVRRWKKAGCIGEMGWHPNLTMDEPVAPHGTVSSLLDRQGKLASLGISLARMAAGKLRYGDVIRELDAQYRRFCDLVGHAPSLLNGHKHIHVFPMVSRALTEVLERWQIRPYVRRVVEPWRCIKMIRGARVKRLFLSTLGHAAAKRQDRAGFLGNEYLAGITDPRWIEDPRFYSRWLQCVPGRIVELAVHPGHLDEALVDRDCSRTDGQLERRVNELRLLSQPSFLEACTRAGFALCQASRIGMGEREGLRHSA
jgi:predicted glycoside hydrolase/deacetylase ChbG (UPF0249 family)